MPSSLTRNTLTYANGLTVRVLDLGQFALDGGAMFGVVPKTLWCRCMQADANNRVTLALNTLLITYQEEVILIDTGVGQKFTEKYEQIYALNNKATTAQENTPPLDRLIAALAEQGLSPADVTQVCYTHLHFDHAGGGTLRTDGEAAKPLFPNARYRVHRGEWEHAIHPNDRNRASYLEENLLPLQTSGQLDLLEGNETELLPGLLPGLTLHRTGGHTPDHQAVIYDPQEGIDEAGFIFWGDLIPTRHHVKIPYVMGYDEYPMECMEAKRLLLRESVDKQRLHIFEHDVEVAVAQLTPDPSGKPDLYRVIAVGN